MLNTKDRIEELKTNGYQLDFGTVFETAFENYKKIALYAGLMLIVFGILTVVVIMVGLVAYIGVENLESFTKKLREFRQIQDMPLDIAIPLNAGILLFGGLLHPFTAGFFKMAHFGEKGEEFHVSTMFSYYKFPYFINIFLYVIVVGFINTGLVMLLQSAGLSFVGTVVNLLISFLTFLSVPLIVFGNLNAIEAIKSSIIIVSKQPLVLLGLIIVSIVGVSLGIFGFCIGLFFTWPFMYSMTYTIYKTIVGLDISTKIDEIISN